MKNWVDVIFVLASLVSFIRGYRAGFITSIFSFIGYIGGGLLGLTLGLHYFHSRGVTKFFAQEDRGAISFQDLVWAI